VENGRGKKGKKAIWHLTLGLRDTIFAGIGVVGLMMMSFALGALAGRGDIYRVAYSWGLLDHDGPKVAQFTPPAAAPPVPPQGAATGAAPVAAVPPTPAGAPTPAGPAAPVAAAPTQGAPVAGSIAPAPSAAPSVKKKTKSGTSSREQKAARDEELHRLRQEVAQKLKFQNSFDTAPKPAKLSGKQKPKDKEKAKTAAAPTQVKVAQFRDAKSANAKVAELQKKGIKATLKQGKDQKGAYYTVYRQSAAPTPGSEKLAQKPEKATESKPKPNSQ